MWNISEFSKSALIKFNEKIKSFVVFKADTSFARNRDATTVPERPRYISLLTLKHTRPLGLVHTVRFILIATAISFCL